MPAKDSPGLFGAASALGGGLFKQGFTADPKKNFLENYSDHLNFVEKEYSLLNKKMVGMPLTKQLDFVLRELTKRSKLFEQYKDGHDLADDVLGVTVLPAMGMAVALAELCKGLYEGALGLYHHLRYGADDAQLVEIYADRSINHLANAAVVFVAVAAATLLNAVNLLTRPFVTAVKGFAASESKRFQEGHDKDSEFVLPNQPNPSK